MTFLPLLRLASVALCAALIPALAGAEESSGSWRGKWWNYYERGLARGDEGAWEQARGDFAKAADLRDKDQRRARTYGMHFIDYFPHRELGVAFYHLGDLDRALKELEASHESQESAKASFYLNEVRRKLLKRQGAVPRPPLLTITAPATGRPVKDPVLLVTGRASTEGLVSSVRVNGRPYRFDLAQRDIDFAVEVPLEDDDAEIVIEATNLMGATSRSVAQVMVDREGPSFSLSALSRQPGSAGEVRIGAHLSDRSGIAQLLVNGVPVATGDARELELDTVALPAAGSGRIRIEATDLLGNQTSAELDPERDRAQLKRTTDRVLLALNLPGVFTSDKEAPLISLKDTDDLPAAYIDRYYVEGEAFDNGRIERITVNGREIQIAPGKKVFFSKMVKLKEGGNRVTVEAFDGSGNKSAASFTVKRVVPAAYQGSARMTLSVLPFNGRIKNAAVQEMADDFLVAALVDQKRFQIVEREKLKQIMQEQKLAKEKLTDPEHSIAVGKMLAADAILATTIAEGQRSVELVARLVSTETGEVMETKDAYLEEKGLAAVKELMEGLAAKLTLGFPVVEGMVIKKERNTLYSDLSAARGLRKSMPAAIYRRGKEIRHPVTGKSLGYDMGKIGDGTVEDVLDGFSKIRLHDNPKQEIQAKDVVITR